MLLTQVLALALMRALSSASVSQKHHERQSRSCANQAENRHGEKDDRHPCRCRCLEERERGRLIVAMRNIQQASETVLGTLEYASAHWRRHMSRNKYDNLSCQS